MASGIGVQAYGKTTDSALCRWRMSVRLEVFVIHRSPPISTSESLHKQCSSFVLPFLCTLSGQCTIPSLDVLGLELHRFDTFFAGGCVFKVGPSGVDVTVCQWTRRAVLASQSSSYCDSESDGGWSIPRPSCRVKNAHRGIWRHPGPALTRTRLLLDGDDNQCTGFQP